MTHLVQKIFAEKTAKVKIAFDLYGFFLEYAPIYLLSNMFHLALTYRSASKV